MPNPFVRSLAQADIVGEIVASITTLTADDEVQRFLTDILF